MDWTHLLSALAGAVPAGLAAVGVWLSQRRKDAIKEWQEIVDRQLARVDQLEQKVETLARENRECERRAAELEAEVRVLRIQLDALTRQATAPTPVVIATPAPPAAGS